MSNRRAYTRGVVRDNKILDIRVMVDGWHVRPGQAFYYRRQRVGKSTYTGPVSGARS